MPAQKRVGAASAEAVKKCRVVWGGIKAAQLPATTQDLLSVELLQHSLGVPMDLRHVFQGRMVGIVGNLIDKVEDSLRSAVTDNEISIKTAETNKAGIDASHAGLENRKSQLEETEREVQKQLAAATRIFRSARTELSEVRSAEAAGEKDVTKVFQKEALLTNTLETTITPWVETGKAPAGTSIAVLQKMLSQFEFNESMIHALPTAFAKSPSERGPFDTITINQLTEEVNKRLEALRAQIEGASVAKAAGEARIKEAENKLGAAMAQLVDSADAWREAHGAREAAEAAIKVASDSAWEADAGASNAAKSLSKAKDKLVKFQEGPKVAFAQLRDCTSAAAEAEDAVAQAADSAECAEGAAGDSVEASGAVATDA